MKGKAIIFSAPSGAGKTTIVKRLLEKIPSLEFSISATTRPKRSFEVHGKDYYFHSFKEFDEMRDNEDLYEWEEVYEDTYYGTLKSEVDRIWKSGNHVIFDVDVQGGLRLKRKLAEDAIAIFVNVKSPEILKERLQKRNTETEETLNERVSKSIEEMKEQDKFDQVVLNEDLDQAVSDAVKIVRDFIG
ncbi:MAG: guanylate kinase [Ekhidna sp.]